MEEGVGGWGEGIAGRGEERGGREIGDERWGGRM